MPTTDRRPALVESYDFAADITSGVRPDQLAGPTPCPAYDVAALLDHLVNGGWMAVAAGRGERPSAVQPHVALADAALELRRAGAEADWAWADDARLIAKIDMPWGETYTGATIVDIYLAELVAHTWDLAAATGQLDRMKRSCATHALEGARAMLKPEYRDLDGKGNPFGAEVEATAGASDWDRLAAFMGRDPESWRR
jgi:uncharacterized protein (TIGR03086 family)